MHPCMPRKQDSLPSQHRFKSPLLKMLSLIIQLLSIDQFVSVNIQYVVIQKMISGSEM